jgi:hypothetical protein
MDNDQQAKLTQLRAITSKDHGEQDIQVLESVGWDVQVSRIVLRFRRRTHESSESRGTVV